jgi:hypothetical protein
LFALWGHFLSVQPEHYVSNIWYIQLSFFCGILMLATSVFFRRFCFLRKVSLRLMANLVIWRFDLSLCLIVIYLGVPAHITNWWLPSNNLMSSLGSEQHHTNAALESACPKLLLRVRDWNQRFYGEWARSTAATNISGGANHDDFSEAIKWGCLEVGGRKCRGFRWWIVSPIFLCAASLVLGGNNVHAFKYGCSFMVWNSFKQNCTPWIF